MLNTTELENLAQKKILSSREIWDNINTLINTVSLQSNALMWLAETLTTNLLNQNIEAHFRTIPGVMDQIILHKDNNTELRFHIYSENSSETYIHNHANPFISLCLEWGYIENLWGMSHSDDTKFYEFSRDEWWQLSPKTEKLWKLEIHSTRQHYPWNYFFVPSDSFHTIGIWKPYDPPITFIIKTRTAQSSPSRVYSTSEIIQEPTEPIQISNNQEKEYAIERMKKWINTRQRILNILPL